MIWWMIGLAFAVAAAGLVLGGLLQVEDWSRDLTVNQASTATDHPDARLRPLAWSRSVSESVAAIRRVVERLPRWRFESCEEQANGEAVVRLTRRTALWRFTDDIEVTIEPTAEGATLNLASRSRVGRGDLGQNPRNLRELLDGLRADRP